MKKTVLKTLSLTLCMIMMLSVICVSAESYVTLYAEGGRYKAFPASKVNAQLTVGWYRYPVQRLYAEGKSKVFPQSQVQAQLTVGWYTEPVQRLYAEGKSKVFPKSQVAAQLTVGWYTEPVQRLYAPGKSKIFKKSQVAAQLTVGWYTTPVSTNYNQNTASKPSAPNPTVPSKQIVENLMENNIGDSAYKPKVEQLTDNYGNTYNEAIYSSYDLTWEYLLDMKYSGLKGTLYIPKGETADKSCQMKVIADGKTIYTSPRMTKTSRPVNFDINVKGYNHIKIELDFSSNYYIKICVGNAGFYK